MSSPAKGTSPCNLAVIEAYAQQENPKLNLESKALTQIKQNSLANIPDALLPKLYDKINDTTAKKKISGEIVNRVDKTESASFWSSKTSRVALNKFFNTKKEDIRENLRGADEETKLYYLFHNLDEIDKENPSKSTEELDNSATLKDVAALKTEIFSQDNNSIFFVEDFNSSSNNKPALSAKGSKKTIQKKQTSANSSLGKESGAENKLLTKADKDKLYPEGNFDYSKFDQVVEDKCNKMSSSLFSHIKLSDHFSPEQQKILTKAQAVVLIRKLCGQHGGQKAIEEFIKNRSDPALIASIANDLIIDKSLQPFLKVAIPYIYAYRDKVDPKQFLQLVPLIVKEIYKREAKSLDESRKSINFDDNKSTEELLYNHDIAFVQKSRPWVQADKTLVTKIESAINNLHFYQTFHLEHQISPFMQEMLTPEQTANIIQQLEKLPNAKQEISELLFNRFPKTKEEFEEIYKNLASNISDSTKKLLLDHILRVLAHKGSNVNNEDKALLEIALQNAHMNLSDPVKQLKYVQGYKLNNELTQELLSKANRPESISLTLISTTTSADQIKEILNGKSLEVLSDIFAELNPDNKEKFYTYFKEALTSLYENNTINQENEPSSELIPALLPLENKNIFLFFKYMLDNKTNEYSFIFIRNKILPMHYPEITKVNLNFFDIEALKSIDAFNEEIGRLRQDAGGFSFQTPSQPAATSSTSAGSSAQPSTPTNPAPATSITEKKNEAISTWESDEVREKYEKNSADALNSFKKAPDPNNRKLVPSNPPATQAPAPKIKTNYTEAISNFSTRSQNVNGIFYFFARSQLLSEIFTSFDNPGFYESLTDVEVQKFNPTFLEAMIDHAVEEIKKQETIRNETEDQDRDAQASEKVMVITKHIDCFIKGASPNSSAVQRYNAYMGISKTDIKKAKKSEETLKKEIEPLD